LESRGEATSIFSETGEPFRESLGRFLVRHEEELRRIARRKLNESSRSVFDSGDVVASVMRRLDSLVMRGQMRARTEAELWGLIRSVLEKTAITKIRMMETARRHFAEDGPYSTEVLSRLERFDDDEASLLIFRMAQSIPNAADRQVFFLRLRGISHKACATLTGSTEEAVKARWHRVRTDLQRRFEEGVFDG